MRSGKTGKDFFSQIYCILNYINNYCNSSISTDISSDIAALFKNPSFLLGCPLK